MRVLICPDRMGPLSSADAGRALAAGWPDADTRIVGEAGQAFVEATADSWGARLQTAVLDGVPMEWAVRADTAVVGVGRSAGPDSGSPIPYQASSVVLGQALARVLREHRPARALVDLAGVDAHDGGAGLLAALGATPTGGDLTAGAAGLCGLTDVDVGPARDLLADIELVGVLPSGQRDDQLLGLRGITSRRGRAAGEDPARLLATDAALQRLTDLVDPQSASAPGAGACGGIGWAVVVLGGRLATGPGIGLHDAEGSYDLVVTGCGVFDFATRGGGVVAAAADLAADRLAPCIVIAGEVLIGGREMRTMGVEAAYPIHVSGLDRPTAGSLTLAEVQHTAVKVARSWRW